MNRKPFINKWNQRAPIIGGALLCFIAGALVGKYFEFRRQGLNAFECLQTGPRCVAVIRDLAGMSHGRIEFYTESEFNDMIKTGVRREAAD